MTFVDCDGMCQARDCLLDASPPGALAREMSRISGTVAESGTCTLTCAVLSVSLCERRVIWCSTVGALPREPPRGLIDALVVCACLGGGVLARPPRICLSISASSAFSPPKDGREGRAPLPLPLGAGLPRASLDGVPRAESLGVRLSLCRNSGLAPMFEKSTARRAVWVAEAAA